MRFMAAGDACRLATLEWRQSELMRYPIKNHSRLDKRQVVSHVIMPEAFRTNEETRRAARSR